MFIVFPSANFTILLDGDFIVSEEILPFFSVAEIKIPPRERKFLKLTVLFFQSSGMAGNNSTNP